MPFRSKAQQGYLFANKPDIAREFADATPQGTYKKLPKRVAKKSNVSPEDLQAKTPTHVTTLKLLGPTDPPTQKVTTAGPESSQEALKKQANALAALCIAGLAKTEAEKKAYANVARLTKLAEGFVHTGSLRLAIKKAYPEADYTKQDLLLKGLVGFVREKRADTQYLGAASAWLDAVVAPLEKQAIIGSVIRGGLGLAGKALAGGAGLAGKGIMGAARMANSTAGRSIIGGSAGLAAANNVLSDQQGIAHGIGSTVGGVVGGARDIVKGIASAPSKAWQGMKSLASPVTDAISGFGQDISKGYNDTVGGVSEAVGSFGERMRNGYNSGAGNPPTPTPAPTPAATPAPGTAAASSRDLRGTGLPYAPGLIGNRLGNFTRKIGMHRPKQAETALVPMPSAPAKPVTPKNVPTGNTKYKSKVRYSFNRAPAKH